MASDTNAASGTSQFDRVRNRTSDQVNRNIDQKIAEQVQQYASQPAAIAQRLQELEREWDTERVLVANASVLAFTGLMLGLFVNLSLVLADWDCFTIFVSARDSRLVSASACN